MLPVLTICLARKSSGNSPKFGNHYRTSEVSSGCQALGGGGKGPRRVLSGVPRRGVSLAAASAKERSTQGRARQETLPRALLGEGLRRSGEEL